MSLQKIFKNLWIPQNLAKSKESVKQKTSISREIQKSNTVCDVMNKCIKVSNTFANILNSVFSIKKMLFRTLDSETLKTRCIDGEISQPISYY